METLCLIIDTVALVLVMYFSMKNEKRPAGEPEIGYFRIAEPGSRVKKSPQQQPQQRRSRVL